MRSFSKPLNPKAKRKARQAEAFGAGASSSPASQKALASLQYQRMGGTFRTSGTALKPKFIKP